MFNKFEFVVIDYFDALDPEVESRGEFFEEAYKMYEKAVQAGIIQFRDVGWFSYNLEHRSQHKPAGIGSSGQVIRSVKYDVSRTLDMLSQGQQVEQTKITFLGIVMYLTGDWIKPTKCDEILSSDSKT